MEKRTIAVTMGAYFAVCLIALIWPVASWANKIEPFVLGMPFFMFWYVLWTFFIFLGCVITYKLEYPKGE
ncbi:DUF3311 domain-containing protein [Bacillus marinisedimentorum]|uniref:DUF3311 domain-containing protein n=1 Tax=Bacillus marinisedimentorum TaxID=1821260 RepID=UPI0007E1988C|nr:DUF3311 domain-containing protein [Bacillus marinisedimentorum]